MLCPPHLVDQWVTELEARFHIRAGRRHRRERQPPRARTCRRARASSRRYPHTVVSLDYIKSERRRAEFLRACPEFVIVDEAHTCAATGQGRHQRYELLKGLTESRDAPPGDAHRDAAQRRRGRLLPPARPARSATSSASRTRPARSGRSCASGSSRHFVQRRRPDIAEWKEGNLFPAPRDDGAHLPAHGRVGAVLRRRARLLRGRGRMRPAATSGGSGSTSGARSRSCAAWPRARRPPCRRCARVPGSTRRRDDELKSARGARLRRQLPTRCRTTTWSRPRRRTTRRWRELIAQAEQLAGQAGDPKLKLLTDHLGQLIADGFNPVVFCRYIATAHYLGRHLAGTLPGRDGRRRHRRADLRRAQREGRRCSARPSGGCSSRPTASPKASTSRSTSTPSSTTTSRGTRRATSSARAASIASARSAEIGAGRATLIYGANNPVDGAVLEVILRKAEKIREELGVPVPLPDDGHTLTQALMKAVLLRRAEGRRAAAVRLRQHARSAGYRRRAGRTRPRRRSGTARSSRSAGSSRRTCCPSGTRRSPRSAARRTCSASPTARWRASARASSRCAAASRHLWRRCPRTSASGSRPRDWRARSSSTSRTRRRPDADRCSGAIRSSRCSPRRCSSARWRAMSDDAGRDPGVLGRVGCWVSADVSRAHRRGAPAAPAPARRARERARSSTLLVEEATALAWTCSANGFAARGRRRARAARAAAGRRSARARARARRRAGARAACSRRLADLDAFAERRAQALLADHRRVREAADARGSYSVKALLPPDVIGLFVLLPQGGLTGWQPLADLAGERRSSPSRRSSIEGGLLSPEWLSRVAQLVGRRAERGRLPHSEGAQPPRRDRPLLAHRAGALARLRGRPIGRRRRAGRSPSASSQPLLRDSFGFDVACAVGAGRHRGPHATRSASPRSAAACPSSSRPPAADSTRLRRRSATAAGAAARSVSRRSI